MYVCVCVPVDKPLLFLAILPLKDALLPNDCRIFINPLSDNESLLYLYKLWCTIDIISNLFYITLLHVLGC